MARLDLSFLAYDRVKFVVLLLLKMYDDNGRTFQNEEWVLSEERTGQEFGRGNTDNRGDHQVAVELIQGVALDSSVRFRLAVAGQIKTRPSPRLGTLTQFSLDEWDRYGLASDGANKALAEELLRRGIIKGVNQATNCQHCGGSGKCSTDKIIGINRSCAPCRKKAGSTDPLALVKCGECDGKGKIFPPSPSAPSPPQQTQQTGSSIQKNFGPNRPNWQRRR